jgi:hypothetical protein
VLAALRASAETEREVAERIRERGREQHEKAEGRLPPATPRTPSAVAFAIRPMSSYARNWPRRSATFVAAYGSTKVAVLAPSPGTVTGCVIVAFAALVTASPKVTTAPALHPPVLMLTS